VCRGVAAGGATGDDLLDLFVRLCGVASPYGAERDIADVVTGYLTGLGLAVREDDSAAVTRCGSGNLVALIRGRGEAPTIGLCAHLDTVPMERAPTVVVTDGRVHTDGTTPLGADDKGALAAILTLARDLVAEPPAGDVELILTVGEENGLLGAKALDLDKLAATRVFVLDSDGAPGTLITSAPSQKRLEAEFRGQAAHAGIAPEMGRSAIVAAARAIAAMRLGRLDDETTANIGLIDGGTAPNVVAERCVVSGEARSRDEVKVTEQMEHMVQTIAAEAAAVGVDVEIDVREAFRGYRHEPEGELMRLGIAAARLAGLEPRLVEGGGGSDANVLNACGVPALTLGAGFEHAHSPRESMTVEHLHGLYAMAVGLVRAAGTAA
jgi:tripeptide aminopeptidase